MHGLPRLILQESTFTRGQWKKSCFWATDFYIYYIFNPKYVSSVDNLVSTTEKRTILYLYANAVFMLLVEAFLMLLKNPVLFVFNSFIQVLSFQKLYTDFANMGPLHFTASYKCWGVPDADCFCLCDILTLPIVHVCHFERCLYNETLNNKSWNYYWFSFSLSFNKPLSL